MLAQEVAAESVYKIKSEAVKAFTDIAPLHNWPAKPSLLIYSGHDLILQSNFEKMNLRSINLLIKEPKLFCQLRTIHPAGPQVSLNSA